MTAARRTVRATPRFFADLDRQLPTERGPNGEPSTNDFQVLDLLRIVERFAIGWDGPRGCFRIGRSTAS